MSPDDSGAGRTDWAAQATRKVGDLVSLVRDRTVRPASKLVSYLLLGLLGAFVGATVAVLFAVGFVRLLDTEIFHRRVWASYLIVGGIFSMSGLFITRMRRRRT
ncbi:MAG: hypothetical protein ACRDZ6_12355 [Acidimicrobiales bacterium]